MGRKPIDRQGLRERVLDVAERMIQQRGLVRASMSDLVRTSGVSRRTFYKVFGSKDDVIKALVDRKIEHALKRAMDIFGGRSSTADKIERMLGIVQRVTSFVTPELMREMATAHPNVWEHINERRMVVLGMWRRILVEGQRQGDIRRDVDPDIFMILLQAIAQNVINPGFLSEHELTIGQMIDQVRIVLLYGLVVRETEPGGRAARGEEIDR
jgi:AcrR family transcriptional regulator